jgi:hypothetical protein
MEMDCGASSILRQAKKERTHFMQSIVTGGGKESRKMSRWRNEKQKKKKKKKGGEQKKGKVKDQTTSNYGVLF